MESSSSKKHLLESLNLLEDLFSSDLYKWRRLTCSFKNEILVNEESKIFCKKSFKSASICEIIMFNISHAR